MSKRRRTFLDLPRNLRRDKFVSLRWKIANDTDGQGVFTTRHVLPGSAEWDNLTEEEGGMLGVVNHHAEARFLSVAHASSGRLYHGDFRTIELAVFEHLEELVDAKIKATLDAVGLTSRDTYAPFKFGPPQGHGRNKTYELIDNVTPRLDVFGGQTVWAAEAYEWEKLTRAEWGSLAPSFRLDFSCKSGIDLFAIVPDHHITLSTIAERIKQFIKLGETSVVFDEVDATSYVPVIEKMIEDTIALKRKIDAAECK